MQEQESKSLLFRIEAVLPERQLVFARRLTTDDFALRDCSTLGGYRVEYLDMPRKLRADGTVDVDLFCFRLAVRPDPSSFPVGSVAHYDEEPP